jgi:hypothetical protein
MPSIKRSKKYQKNMDFVKQLQDMKIFETISKISLENGEVIKKWQEDGFNWRMRFTQLKDIIERNISCCKILEEGLPKKERKKQYTFKSCYIYDEGYISSDKYKIITDKYIIDDIIVLGL